MLYRSETKEDAGGCLIDLALYDRDKKLIFKTYSFDLSKRESQVGEHVVTLAEDERVVGFVSRQPSQ